MAIPQSRLEALLIAAKDFQEQWQTARQAADDAFRALPSDPTTAECIFALSTIQRVFSQSLVKPEHVALLAREETHIKLTKKKNAKVAEYQRRKRAAEGAKQMPHLSPVTIGITKSEAPRPPSFQNLSPLANLKMRYNALHRDFGMPEPYANPLDDAAPLLPDHALAAQAEGISLTGTNPAD